MPLKVSEVIFTQSEQAIFSVRCEVFVIEQQVPIELEIDGLDPACRHVLARLGDSPVGTGRITAEGKIGRIAVLKSFRRKGCGRAILEKLEDIALSMSLSEVTLGAQTNALGFYEMLGYSAYGDVFMDADIPHIHMKKTL